VFIYFLNYHYVISVCDAVQRKRSSCCTCTLFFHFLQRQLLS